jgi:signal transduction histidine kinase
MDELEFLSFSFERMSKQVQQSFQSLESANQVLQQTVAERTAALDQLQQAQIQLVQSEKMSGLGQMLAGIAHEINNPVNFIYGNLDHIKNYTTDLISLIHQYQSLVQVIPQNVRSQYLSDLESEAEFDAEELAFIEEDLGKILGSMTLGTERIRQLVLSLRNFSRSDQGMHQPFQINEGIESTLALLNHRLKANSQRPAIQVATQLGDLPLVDCYPGPLNQVLMNLLANAIDALEERTARWDFPKIEANPNRLTITTRLVKSDSSQLSNSSTDTDTVEIAITDNGSGIPPAIQAKIFDPFFTTKPVGKGTGIGLSISYQIVVEKHHGVLTCCSQPDQGTTFMIRLPLKQPTISIAGVAHGAGGNSRAPATRSESLET